MGNHEYVQSGKLPKVKAAVSTEIRTGDFPDVLCDVVDARCFIGGVENLFCIGFGVFFTVSCIFC